MAEVEGHASAGVDKDPIASDDCLSLGASIYCDGCIEDKPVKMLVDTGSVITLVHFDLFQQIRGKVAVEPFTEVITSANGQPLQTAGQALLTIEIAQKKFYHKAIICKDLAHMCIIGTDFLGKTGACVDFSKGMLKVQSRTAKLQMGRCGASSVCRITVRDTVLVPGRHEMLIPGKIRSSERGVQLSGKTGVFEPKKRFSSGEGLLLAHSLTVTNGNQVPIRLINLSNEDIMLYKNTK